MVGVVIAHGHALDPRCFGQQSSKGAMSTEEDIGVLVFHDARFYACKRKDGKKPVGLEGDKE